ncbi:MAG: hypothetical protein JXR58_06830 [Bacteroidales bacterium]|nr:hypothetical protein [Bacteroidales bacterium]
MDLRNIIDFKEKKQKKKNDKKFYWLLSLSIICIGLAFLFRDADRFTWNMLVLLSAVFFTGYLTMNFVNWEEKLPYHYIQFVGNVALTTGLMLKIMSISYDNPVIFLAIGLIFLSFVVSFFN